MRFSRTRLSDVAVILDVYPVAADRQASVTIATAPAGPEPGIEELFRSYLAEEGTRGAAADRHRATVPLISDGACQVFAATAPR